MFHSKYFASYEGDQIASWLNSLRMKGHYVKVEAISSMGGVGVLVVAGVFMSRVLGETPVRTTIDEIPEEPAIHYPDDELQEDKTGL